jgi:hypothetical protein
MNAKIEFLKEIENRKLVCARIGTEGEYNDEKDEYVYNWKVLKNNYNEKEFADFCTSLSFEYDEGFGGQELFGIILFEDSYSDRHEYDGAENWVNHKMPTIEEVLTPQRQH